MKIEEVLSLVRQHIRSLQPYSSARDEFDQSSVDAKSFIYLDANENPYNTGYNRYPDPHQRELKSKLGAIKNINPENMFLGNGSDEPIDLLIRLFCSEKNNVVIPSPTYGMYKVSAEINHVSVKAPLLTSDFQIDAKAVVPSLDEDSRIIFLCSPNNPTGNLLKSGEIETLLKTSNKIVVVDEAYIDFSQNQSWSQRLDEFPNMIVLQTLSKAWGLAGLRLGMAMAHEEIIRLLDKIKSPYNISSAAQDLVSRALDNIKFKDEWVRWILDEREFLTSSLKEMTGIEKVYPTDANFFLVRMPNAHTVYQQLVEKGIVVRDRSNVKLCEGCLRITVGTHEENVALLSALKSLMS